jgi:hypothetical protein
VGRWGIFENAYARIQELGGTIKQDEKTVTMKTKKGKVTYIRSAREIVLTAKPYLMPAADAKYPELAANIQAALDKVTSNG